MDPIYLGIEIGGTKLQIAAGNAVGKILQRWRFNVEARRGGAGIREQLESSLREIAPANPPISGVGVGFGGPVNWQTGVIACSHQVEGWSGYELGSWLGRLTKLPVRVDNDANVAALGEALYGAGQGATPVFYVTLGSGVGGGLAVNQKIYHGAHPGEAEIGHVRLDRQGAIVETRCSGWAVDAQIRQLKTTHPDCLLAQLTKGISQGEAKFLAAACQKGDEWALQILRRTAEDLAFGLSHVVHLFHPEIIVIGGGLSLMGEILRAAAAQALPEFVMKAFAPGPKISLAALGEDAVPAGALALARAAAEAASSSTLSAG